MVTTVRIVAAVTAIACGLALCLLGNDDVYAPLSVEASVSTPTKPTTAEWSLVQKSSTRGRSMDYLRLEAMEAAMEGPRGRGGLWLRILIGCILAISASVALVGLPDVGQAVFPVVSMLPRRLSSGADPQPLSGPVSKKEVAGETRQRKVYHMTSLAHELKDAVEDSDVSYRSSAASAVGTASQTQRLPNNLQADKVDVASGKSTPASNTAMLGSTKPRQVYHMTSLSHELEAEYAEPDEAPGTLPTEGKEGRKEHKVTSLSAELDAMYIAQGFEIGDGEASPAKQEQKGRAHQMTSLSAKLDTMYTAQGFEIGGNGLNKKFV